VPPILRIPEDRLEIEARSGESLQDLCNQHSASVLFGCFSARCGVCRIKVLDHPESLTPMTEMEQDLLQSLSAPTGERLACQCCIVGDVTIETVRLI